MLAVYAEAIDTCIKDIKRDVKSNFVGDCIKGNCINGAGTFKFYTGDNYTGEWKNNKANGQGILYNKNGKIKNKGLFKDGLFIK